MEWISTKIKFPKSDEEVLTACKNKNMEDGIWLYDLCYYYSGLGWEGRINWEDVLYWTYIDKPKQELIMAQYIPKPALLAEIEKLKKSEGWCQVGNDTADVYYVRGFRFACERIINVLNTLEVKEVDLEKECSKYFEDNDSLCVHDDYIKFAKHFFELGMQAQSDEKLVEEIYSHLDSIKDIADRMTSGNFMHNKAAIKLSANTIAKVLELMGLKIEKGE